MKYAKFCTIRKFPTIRYVIRLLSTMWPYLQSFPLLYAGVEGKAEASTMSNSANPMSSC